MTTRKTIIVRTQFEAVHRWSDCPHDDVNFLRFPHRHIFYVEVEAEVTSSDREIEFIRLKRSLARFLAGNYDLDIGERSCEMICEEILQRFPILDSVSVFEDNENGARIRKKGSKNGDEGMCD